jgi:hypothetical protein
MEKARVQLLPQAPLNWQVLVGETVPSARAWAQESKVTVLSALHACPEPTTPLETVPGVSEEHLAPHSAMRCGREAGAGPLSAESQEQARDQAWPISAFYP